MIKINIFFFFISLSNFISNERNKINYQITKVNVIQLLVSLSFKKKKKKKTMACRGSTHHLDDTDAEHTAII